MASEDVLRFGQVRTRLRLSGTGLRHLDKQLRPWRSAGGNRLYSRAAVERFAVHAEALAVERLEKFRTKGHVTTAEFAAKLDVPVAEIEATVASLPIGFGIRVIPRATAERFLGLLEARTR